VEWVAITLKSDKGSKVAQHVGSCVMYAERSVSAVAARDEWPRVQRLRECVLVTTDRSPVNSPEQIH